jgi:hypothetical protein
MPRLEGVELYLHNPIRLHSVVAWYLVKHRILGCGLQSSIFPGVKGENEERFPSE